MSLVRNTGLIGGLTMVSRVFGFVRDMMLARVLGAGLASDAFLLAFQLPNIFRRLFAEGAFSAAFVPMFARKMKSDDSTTAAERFSSEVFAVLLVLLVALTALVQTFMPAVMWLLAAEFRETPGKFELSVLLARITFPYIVLISIVSLMTGILNSLSRFAAGASFPIILNLVLIIALTIAAQIGGDDRQIAILLAGAVTLAGVAQLGWLWFWLKRSGFRLTLARPRLTPDVRELGIIVLPAVFGAGVYQINQLVQLFFLTRLPEGSLAYLNFADRLNQLPLGIIGIALGTAILPALSRHIAGEDRSAADRLQSNAIELAMLLTLPAAVALAITAEPIVTAFFQGGRFDSGDAAITARVLAMLVAGLPAYVLIKVLTPAYFARKDTRTPVYAALVALIIFAGFNALYVERFGLVGLVAATAAGAWINSAILYAILLKRGHYRLDGRLLAQIARQMVATAAMAAALWPLAGWATGHADGSIAMRVIALSAMVGSGAAVYFGVAFATGALNRDQVMIIVKRRKAV